MKNIRKLKISILTLILLILLYNMKYHNYLLLEIKYEDANKRAELGHLFYEKNDKIAFNLTIGVFVYNIRNGNIENSFNFNAEKAFGIDTYYNVNMSEDEKNIIIFGIRDHNILKDYYFKYNLKNRKVVKIKGSVLKEKICEIPTESRRLEAFNGSSWDLDKFIYNPKNSNIKLYPFKEYKY